MTTIGSEICLGDGLSSSPQGFGAMALSGVYGSADSTESLATLHHTIDLGVRMIDTANIYGGGENEKLIAGVLRTRRADVLLATKFGIPTADDPGGIRAQGDRAYVHRCVKESLGRLKVDAIDLYYYHRVDPRVPIEETVGALSELVAAGDVRHIGLSEVTASELRRANSVHPIAAVQSEWSLWSRDVESEIVPMAAELGVGFVPYSPLGRGFLTGAAQTDLAADDLRLKFPRFGPGRLEQNRALFDALAALAAEHEITPAQTALAWLYAKGRAFGLPVVPIPGTRRASRVDENAAAAQIILSADAIAELDSLAAGVHGDRASDLLWISQGRESAAPHA